MTKEKMKIIPLEYAPTESSTRVPFWPLVVPDEAAEKNHIQLLAQIRQLTEENAQQLRNFEQQIGAARTEAYEAGRRQQEEQHSRVSASAVEAFVRAIDAFSAGCDRYFAEVEREVVRLALNIAARILHREAQMDPLLLSGVVKVALGQLAESTEVQLRIPATEAALWTEMLRLMPNLPLRPTILPDDQLRSGECKLETHLGTVDLGVRAQLEEIERGFFDLLDQRLKVTHAATA